MSEKKKVKVLVQRPDPNDGESEMSVYIEDGGHAYSWNNGEQLVTQYYQNRLTLEDLNNKEDIWLGLSEGKAYMNDWNGSKENFPYKEKSDDEVMWDMIHWLYSSTEKIEFEIVEAGEILTDDLPNVLKKFIKFE